MERQVDNAQQGSIMGEEDTQDLSKMNGLVNMDTQPHWQSI